MPVSKTRKKPRPKKPITASVDIVLDDDVLHAYDQALGELEQKERELAARRERDIHQALAGAIHIDGPDTPEARRAGAEHTVDLAHEALIDPLQKAVEAAEQAVRDQTDVYRFRALGRAAFNELIAGHPPTDEDVEAARKQSQDPNAQPSWCLATFYPALIAACCYEPDLTLEDAQKICDEWNQAEVDALFMTALGVNTARRDGDAVGKARGRTRSAVR